MLTQACTETKQNEQAKQSEKSEEMKQISPKKYTTFMVNDNIEMYAVTFKNQYKMHGAGHLFIPKKLDRSQKHAAIIVEDRQ